MQSSRFDLTGLKFTTYIYRFCLSWFTYHESFSLKKMFLRWLFWHNFKTVFNFHLTIPHVELSLSYFHCHLQIHPYKWSVWGFHFSFCIKIWLHFFWLLFNISAEMHSFLANDERLVLWEWCMNASYYKPKQSTD